MRRCILTLAAALACAASTALAVGSAPPEPSGKAVLLEKEAKELWVFKESIALGVPEEELAELVIDCRAGGFTMGEIQRILALVAKAKLAGLPHRQLFVKLREGLVKGAQPELIDAALAGRAISLRKAKTLVDELLLDGYAAKDYEMAIEVTADALEVGMSPQQVLNSVRSGRSPGQGMPDPTQAFRKTTPPK